MGCQRVVDPYANPMRALIAVELVGEEGTERLEVTDNHPFWVVDRGWTRTDELSPGDEIASADGGTLAVGSLAWTGTRTVVFNFGVEGFHTYFVGESGAWVHNCWRELTKDAAKTLDMTPAEIADQLASAGYEVVSVGAARSPAATRIVLSGGPDVGSAKISQVLVHPGGGVHGGKYVKISTGEGTKKIVGPDYVKTSQKNVEYFHVE